MASNMMISMCSAIRFRWPCHGVNIPACDLSPFQGFGLMVGAFDTGAYTPACNLDAPSGLLFDDTIYYI